jgi:hypothetical protein
LLDSVEQEIIATDKKSRGALVKIRFIIQKVESDLRIVNTIGGEYMKDIKESTTATKQIIDQLPSLDQMNDKLKITSTVTTPGKMKKIWDDIASGRL